MERNARQFPRAHAQFVTSNAVIAAAKEWIGTPFLHAGRDKSGGVDCIGLIVCVAEELGLCDARGVPLKKRDERGYGRSGVALKLRRALGECLAPVPLDAAAPGDVLLCRIGKTPQHVAFLSHVKEQYTLLHALETAQKVTEHRLSDNWRRRFVSAYRFL